MVQIIENWSCIVGIVLAIMAPPQGGDHGVLRIQVERVEPIAGFADLLADRVGQTIDVRVRSEQLARARPEAGERVRMRVRRGGPTQVFAHPDWVHGQNDACDDAP